MRSILIILIGIIVFTACEKSTKPKELIDEETYKRMFIELAIINQLDQNLMADSTTAEELRNKVYEYYSVTPEEFRISHLYYEKQIDKQIERLKDISAMLGTERDTLVDVNGEYRKAIQSGKLDSLRQSLFSDK